MVGMPTVAEEVKVPAVVEAATAAVVVTMAVVDGTKYTFHHQHIALLKAKEAFEFCKFRNGNIHPLCVI